MTRGWRLVGAVAALFVTPAGALAAAAPTTPAVALTKLAFDMPDGTAYDTVSSGLLCGPKGVRRWQGTPFPDALARYGEAFRAALASAGLAPATASLDLFAADAAPPAFAVGAVVADLRQRTCEVNAFTGPESSVKGRASLRVRWQVFSRAAGKVTARFETPGEAVVGRSVPGGAGRISTAAFADAAARLVRSEGFRQAVGAPPP